MDAASLREITREKANSLAQHTINGVEEKLQKLAESGYNTFNGHCYNLSKGMVIAIVHRHFSLLGFTVSINNEYLNLEW